jgi:hypothetical protein
MNKHRKNNYFFIKFGIVAQFLKKNFIFIGEMKNFTKEKIKDFEE